MTLLVLSTHKGPLCFFRPRCKGTKNLPTKLPLPKNQYAKQTDPTYPPSRRTATVFPMQTLPMIARALAVLTLATIGCRSTSQPTEPVEPPPTPETLRSLALFDGHSGAEASWQELGERIDDADVVVIGELHGHPVGLPFAALLFEESLDRNPDAALALEFVNRDRQYMLDAYLQDVVDWDGLVAAMKGSKGNNVLPHKPMIEAAKRAGRPVYAANAPRFYTRIARKKGYEALKELSAEQQRLFDIPDPMPSGGYRERFFDIMRSPKPDPEQDAEASEAPEEEKEPEPPTERMKSVFRSQSLWDGTMSATTAKAVRAGQRPVFLEIGQFHCDKDGGTMQLLRKHLPGANILVVSVADTWSESLREEDQDRADFIVYVGPGKEH